MIQNIIDSRKRRYRWKTVTAIIEPTVHDNSCNDSDQAEMLIGDHYVYEQREEISLADAVVWAQSKPYAVTLYIYDLGEGITVAKDEPTTRNSN